MTLAALLFDLLVSLVPLESHTYHEARVLTEARYWDTATRIALVTEAEEPLEELSVEQTGMLLAAVLARESAVRDDVMTCRVFGMGGARGPYQTERPRYFAKACASLESATLVALEQLRDSWHVCSGLPMAERASVYTGGARFMTSGARRESRRRVQPMLDVLVFEPGGV